jgi:predicted SprT family Zn-dependent metalloprotease
MTHPTKDTYGAFQTAYDFFNGELFADSLPSCLITLQRKNRVYGYFSPSRFGSIADGSKTDEIAMNPVHFSGRSVRETLGTLVHEMAHLWQEHEGTPPRRCYHDKEWAAKMDELGLTPTATGEAGGKRTGQSVTHMIVEGGPYDAACAKLLATGFQLTWADRFGDQDDAAAKAKAKSGKRAKYTCPVCSFNAWAKPEAKLICGECEELMVSEDGEA